MELTLTIWNENGLHLCDTTEVLDFGILSSP